MRRASLVNSCVAIFFSLAKYNFELLKGKVYNVK